MIRRILGTVIIILVFLTSGCNKSYQANFVFFLVDDLGYMDVGFNNPNSFYETPNLDQLAGEGMKFTNAYAACPVCSPTRASIMTGKYPARLNTTDYFGASQPESIIKNKPRYHISKPLLPASYVDRMPLEELTLAEALKEAGYATFFAGKWHLGPEGFWPEDQGFDVNSGGITRGGPYGGNRYFSPYGNPRLEDGPDGEHLPDRLASDAVKFIDEHAEEPFLVYLSFYSVHTPLMARDDLKAKYEEKAKTVPENSWGEEPPRKVRLVQNHTIYAGMVDAMDQAVGKVLNHLKETGLDKTTAVFMMSDNGGLSTSEGHPTSNLPLRAGKGWLYEGGIREPMLIKWPENTKAGSVCDIPVISTNFYPTILEMAGLDLKPEQHTDGISMLDLLTHTHTQTDTHTLYWHYPHYGNQGGTPGAAIRKGKYKLIEFFEDSHTELYDLSVDIGEKNNLSETMPEVRDELLLLLHTWQEDVDARFPSPNPYYKPQE
ncbi:MAG: sulfatase [Bacteroidetes bacterium]|nr:sulfatase [Bacteroidota bacterium]MBT4412331.1 sulfatase [Bacteroidota bacterium]MBT5428118.1 sulfatase [Bacteroidota bacterium]MBT7094806.1 sulfatase [Bacteroidota bacterium]MBT7465448.1 sulfatase [Bacteroidota bacterium]